MPPPYDLAGLVTRYLTPGPSNSEADRDNHRLKELAVRLAKDGPYKVQETPKRVRVLYNGAYVADTTAAAYVWEHQYYPQYYLPFTTILSQLPNDAVKVVEDIKDAGGKPVAQLLALNVSGKSLQNVINFDYDLGGKGAPLAGMVKIDFKEADQWFEEDTPIEVHPKDPYKRIEIISSNRGVRVSVEGTLLAEANSAHHLFETGLPRRFYLPLTSVKQSYLQPSTTKTKCPYKGEAEYYNVVLPNGSVHKDIVWYYTHPTQESADITGLICFYNEKVDIEIQEDGKWKKLERPKSPFA